MQHKSHTKSSKPRRLINAGVITITEHGFLASIPNTGPGRVMRAKILPLVFDEAPKLGWELRIAGQKWGR